jgi:hypothetical protein
MNKKTLAQILGLIAGALAWTAALISYSKTGDINFGLIAAGTFFAVMPFAASARRQK